MHTTTVVPFLERPWEYETSLHAVRQSEWSLCAFPLTPHFPESLSQELRREEATRDAPVFRQGVAHKKKVHEELKVIWGHSEPAGRCDFSCRTSARAIFPINWPRCVT